MATSIRPNFFLLLGLNPDGEWEQEAFERLLREKRNEWSRQSAGVARKALTAKQNLALISRIQTTMTDTVQREIEAVTAREELASVRKTEQAQFEKQLAFINAKEFVDQEEVERFIATFKHLLGSEDMRARINVRIVSPASSPVTGPSSLDPSLIRSIIERLQFLHMELLYELLQCPDKTATSDLFRAAEQLYTKLVRQSPTAEATAKIELTGLAREVFASDDMRASYDESLRQVSLNELLQELDESMGLSTQKEINHKQVALFLQHAQQEGWKEKEALEKLKEHVRLRKWIMTAPLSSERETLLCPNCEHLNDAQQTYCTKCKQELYIECPDCSQRVSCECIACGNCGFATGNRYLVDRLIEEVSNVLKKGDLLRAQDVVKEAERAWPSHTNDTRQQQIATLKATLYHLMSAHQDAQRDALERLNTLTFSEVMTQTQHSVHVSWQPPTRGAVAIIKSSQALHLEGRTIPAKQLAQLGQRLDQDDSANRASDDWQPLDVAYYTPAIILQQKAHLGISQRYMCAENVKDLSYQNLGSVIRLRWQWPEACHEVDISYNTRDWPREHLPATTTHLLPRDAYDQLGFYEIHDIAHRDYYIRVSAMYQHNDERLVAEGACVFVQQESKVVITYKMQCPAFSRRERLLSLTLRTRQELPRLLVIAKQGGLPFSKTDGEVFHRIEPFFPQPGQVVLRLPDTPLPPKMFGKLFFEDDAMYWAFLVHHPREHFMRLS